VLLQKANNDYLTGGNIVKAFFTLVGVVLLLIMVFAFPVGGVPLALIAGIRFCQAMSRD